MTHGPKQFNDGLNAELFLEQSKYNTNWTMNINVAMCHFPGLLGCI